MCFKKMWVNFKKRHGPMMLEPTGNASIPMAFDIPGPGIPEMPPYLEQRLNPENIHLLTDESKEKVRKRLHSILIEADRVITSQDSWNRQNVFPEDLKEYTRCVGASMLVYRLCRERGYPCRVASVMVGTIRNGRKVGYAKHMFAVSMGYVLDPLSNNYAPQPTTQRGVQYYRISDYNLENFYGVKQHKYLTNFGLTAEQIRTNKNYLP